jgi:hypothetical protein
MAYEDGYKAESYIGTCIENYRKDPLIFSKTSQLLTLFMNRSDWPHCFEELDRATSQILGQPIGSLIFFFTQKYLYDPRIEWPDNTPVGYKQDLEAFHIAVNQIIYMAWASRTDPMNYYAIAQARSYNNNYTVIRFIRMDGASLEMIVDDNSIREIIQTLNKLVTKES